MIISYSMDRIMKPNNYLDFHFHQMAYPFHFNFYLYSHRTEIINLLLKIEFINDMYQE